VTGAGAWEDAFYDAHLSVEVGGGRTVSLEVHRRMSHLHQIEADFREVWRRAEHVRGMEWRMCAEDCLLVCGYHLSRSLPPFRLMWLIDILGIVEELEPDWEVTVGRARRWGVATALWLALTRCEETLGGRFVPVEVVRELEPGPVRRSYLDAVIPRVLIENPFKGLSSREVQALVLFPLMDRWGQRLRFATNYGKVRLLDALGR
jgi:hypothetical protein